MPPEPVSLDSELDLDYIGRDFMKSDIKSADSRHILFATDEQLRLLSNIRTWYVAEHILSSCSRQSSKYKQAKLHELWLKYESRELTTSAFLSECVPLVPL